ncbi:MAG: glycosyltransferase [Actinomycetota bacterium]|nr:glycosyltransferase [Actinomycetota bacterium]
MRVAMIITRSDIIGGASIYVRDLCVALPRRGVDVTAIVGGNGIYLDDLRAHDIPFEVIDHFKREISPSSDVRAYRSLCATLRRLNVDLIAAHTSKSGALARLAGRSLGIPVVYTPHCWAFEDEAKRKATIYYLAERALASLPGVIVNVSHHERKLALQRHIGRTDTHVTIHNGVPDVPPDLLADPRRQPPELIMVARFEPQKDHFTLLEALEGLTELPWTATLVGNGPLEQRARAWVQSHGLADRIFLPGAQPNVDALLGRAQIYVLMSNWESLPLTVLEAMRAGLPVVVSGVGGVPEVVAHGASGYVVNRGDASGLRERLETLIRSPEMRGHFGASGRELYLQEFTHERMLDRLEALYGSVLASNGPRRPGHSMKKAIGAVRASRN